MKKILIIAVLITVAGCYHYEPIEGDGWAPPPPAGKAERWSPPPPQPELPPPPMPAPEPPPPAAPKTEKERSIEKRIDAIEKRLDALLELARKIHQGPGEGEGEGEDPLHADYVLKIDGTIIGVSTKRNLVVINVGEDDGVRIGYTFTIYRDKSYVGKLVVEKIYPRQAACRILKDMTKGKVEAGDQVSTQVE
jgi:hypothetical protein